ncbi:DUF1572 family protein [Rossellomorea aquimaris]|uniref:DUF1572 family protein n=1 Tax=Rossellomorea aquimaris TaxID=189382 RepID=UPI0007D07D34|nr:DUF1572 family protein [Rossellomorea aquimaris]
MNVENEYLKVIRERFLAIKRQGERAISQLSEENIHWVFNESSNSVAVIVKHVSGNMVSRWTEPLTTDGEKPDRNRDKEFENTISSKQDLMNVWEKGWQTLLETLHVIHEQDLLKDIYIRGERHSVLEAIERQLAHYAAHIGQIVFIGKQLMGENWECLSIPKGKSQEFSNKMIRKNK